MTDKSYELYQLKRIRYLIDAKIEEYERILTLGTRMTPILSDMPKGIPDNNTSKVEDTAIKLSEIKESIISELNELTRQYEHAKLVISKIDNLAYQTILTQYYINNMTLEKIATSMAYSSRNIYYILKQAKREYRICEEKIIEKLKINA